MLVTKCPQSLHGCLHQNIQRKEDLIHLEKDCRDKTPAFQRTVRNRENMLMHMPTWHSDDDDDGNNDDNDDGGNYLKRNTFFPLPNFFIHKKTQDAKYFYCILKRHHLYSVVIRCRHNPPSIRTKFHKINAICVTLKKKYWLWSSRVVTRNKQTGAFVLVKKN